MVERIKGLSCGDGLVIDHQKDQLLIPHKNLLVQEIHFQLLPLVFLVLSLTKPDLPNGGKWLIQNLAIHNDSLRLFN